MGAKQILPEDVMRDPEEIELNRHGRISSRQAAALDNVANGMLWPALWPAAGFLCLAAAHELLQPFEAWRSWLVPLGIGELVLAVLAAALMLPRVPQRIRLGYAQREIRAGSVRQCAGGVVVQGTRPTVDAPGSGIYSTALHALPPGYYRFFYLPDTGWLLSAEPVEPTMTRQPEASHVESSRKQRTVR